MHFYFYKNALNIQLFTVLSVWCEICEYGNYFGEGFKFYCTVRVIFSLELRNSGTKSAKRHPVVEIKQISGPYINVFVLVSKLRNIIN